jgi:hypothetical protein
MITRPHGCPRRALWLAITVPLLVWLGSAGSATETDFWQAYRGPDEATYLLATFDDETFPVGTANISRAADPGSGLRAW